MRGAELFCDEIHTVSEGRYQRYVCRAVESQHFIPRNGTMEVVNRRPTRRTILTVDFADQRFDVELQLFVLGDFFAAWNNHLQQRDAALPFLVRLQKQSKC